MSLTLYITHYVLRIKGETVMTTISSVRLGKNPLQVTSFGLGTAPLANLYNTVSDADAIATVQAAYQNGVRLFDTAPLYGLGKSEERVGKALRDLPRSSYVISTKIGRVLKEDRSGYVFDYTRDGVQRSLEGSLRRLGMDYVDILHVHDPDNYQHEALETAFPTLAELRSQGVIKAIGAGMNQWQALEHFARNADFDLFLLAGRYTLLEQTSLSFLKLCKEKGIGIFLGGVYNSGILATGPQPGAKYNYADAPEPILQKAQALQAVCSRYGVPLNVAALQFAGAHPAVTSLVVGAVSPAEVETNLRSLQTPIPTPLWQELRTQKLIEPAAPVPA
jgi:D-threo-aldose 1-dehydrogenase